MPAHDPVPNPAKSMKRRFLRIFRLLVLLSTTVAVIAVIVVSQGDPTLHINMLIATALGIFFTMLLGTSLMSLIFISADSGHDEAAGGPHVHEDKE